MKVSDTAVTSSDIFNSLTMTWSLPPTLLAMPRKACFHCLDTHSCQIKAVFLDPGYVLVLSGVVIEAVVAVFRAHDREEFIEVGGSGNIGIRECVLALWHHKLMENLPNVLL